MYNNPVLGLNDIGPKLAPPCDTMYISLIGTGVYSGRARARSFGSVTIGNVEQNGCIGTPFAV